MPLVSSYFGLGSGVDNGSGTIFTIAGKDFNPTEPSGFFQGTEYRANGTAPTDLSNYRHGHEIVVCVGVWKNNTTSDITATLKFSFVFPGGNTWEYSFGTRTVAANGGGYIGYAYAGIDYDEFKINGQATIGMLANSSILAAQNITYTGYNTSRSTQHPSGALWVDGSNLYYTDASYSSSTGYKHKIDYDTSYSSYVGTSKSGFIWLDDGGDNRRIYYIDDYGYKRRTYLADNRFGGASYVGTNKSGYVWVSDNYDASGGYGYLCFVGANGYKYRIMNGPV